MRAGFARGTISTTVLVANTAGFEQSPCDHSCSGYFGDAAAKTSAGAP